MTVIEMPNDDVGHIMQIIPQWVSKESAILSGVLAAQAFSPIAGSNNFLRILPSAGNVFLKYGAGVTVSDFDEVIPAGQVVDVVYNTDSLPTPYSIMADALTDIIYLVK